MAAICGISIGKELIEALGLQGHRVKTIDFHIEPKAVTADVRMLVDSTEAERFVEVLKRYELHEPRKTVAQRIADEWRKMTAEVEYDGPRGQPCP